MKDGEVGMKDKELKCNIMDDIGNIINTITTKVTETQDEFIFQTISDWWSDKTQRIISKQELIDALTLNKKLVRCKDCKHRGNSKKCVLSAISEEKDSPLFILDNRGNWFCADGERRTDDA